MKEFHRMKTAAFDETRKLFWIFLYLWVLLGLFSFQKALILNEENLIFHQGFTLINALALAKVVLLGEYFRIGENFKNRPLIYPILFKSAIFAVLLVCFHILEELLIGVMRHKTVSQSISSIGDGRTRGDRRGRNHHVRRVDSVLCFQGTRPRHRIGRTTIAPLWRQTQGRHTFAETLANGGGGGSRAFRSRRRLAHRVHPSEQNRILRQAKWRPLIPRSAQ